MANQNLEETAKKVADLASEGQGCAIKLLMEPLSRTEIKTVMDQAKTVSDKRFQETGLLPYVDIAASRDNFMWLDQTKASIKVTDPRIKDRTANILGLETDRLFIPHANCTDLPELAKKK